MANSLAIHGQKRPGRLTEIGWTKAGRYLRVIYVPDEDAEGHAQVPAHIEHHEVVLTDREDGNRNLAFVLADTADAIATLRDEGKRVFVHCAGGHSRMPVVVAAYLRLRLGLHPDDALARAAQALPYVPHNRALRHALEQIDAVS